MASGSLPINFDYTKIEVESYNYDHFSRNDSGGNRTRNNNGASNIGDTDSLS